jgi:hypothetical protein
MGADVFVLLFAAFCSLFLRFASRALRWRATQPTHQTGLESSASHRIASHRIASHRIASHRIASHRIASHRIASMPSSSSQHHISSHQAP